MPPLPQLRCSRTDGVKGSAERRNKGVDKQRTPRHTVRKSIRPTSEQSGPDRPVSAAAITADATNSFKPPYNLLDYVTKRVAEEDVKASTDLIVSEACQADRANLVKELKTRLAVVKRDERRRRQGRSAMFTREELQKGQELWAADRHSLGISLDADRDYPGDSVPDNVAQTEGEDNQGKRIDTYRFSTPSMEILFSCDWLEPPSSLCIALLRALMTTFSFQSHAC